MKTLLFIWIILTCIVGLFHIVDIITRSLPEGNRLRIWWNRHVVSETDLEDIHPPSDESGS
jgi:hypothetical protein